MAARTSKLPGNVTMEGTDSSLPRSDQPGTIVSTSGKPNNRLKMGV
jgi:hypothetical protein